MVIMAVDLRILQGCLPIADAVLQAVFVFCAMFETNLRLQARFVCAQSAASCPFVC